jgi:hypothetical protein
MLYQATRSTIFFPPAFSTDHLCFVAGPAAAQRVLTAFHWWRPMSSAHTSSLRGFVWCRLSNSAILLLTSLKSCCPPRNLMHSKPLLGNDREVFWIQNLETTSTSTSINCWTKCKAMIWYETDSSIIRLKAMDCALTLRRRGLARGSGVWDKDWPSRWEYTQLTYLPFRWFPRSSFIKDGSCHRLAKLVVRCIVAWWIYHRRRIF